MISSGSTAEAALRHLTTGFAAAGIDSPRVDARCLLEAATGISREQLVLAPLRTLTSDEAQLLSTFEARRLAREPVTRILGERSFYGRMFRVTPDTLDPRPETETLVDLALDLLRDETAWPADCRLQPGKSIVDIGTGTGCILLTLLAELAVQPTDKSAAYGIDVSEAALAVARENARRLGLQHQVTWLHVENLEDDRLEHPDLVVSNPPYIRSGEITSLDPEVRKFDPHLALDGGPDGLDIIRDIVTWSAGKPLTWFVLEIGAGQSGPVLDLITRSCGDRVSANARVRQDLGGHARCVAWQPHF